jgi:hypothetical protein
LCCGAGISKLCCKYDHDPPPGHTHLMSEGLPVGHWVGLGLPGQLPLDGPWDPRASHLFEEQRTGGGASDTSLPLMFVMVRASEEGGHVTSVSCLHNSQHKRDGGGCELMVMVVTHHHNLLVFACKRGGGGGVGHGGHGAFKFAAEGKWCGDGVGPVMVVLCHLLSHLLATQTQREGWW